MLKLIKNYIFVIASSLILTTPLVATVGVSATCANDVQSGLASGINATQGQPSVTTTDCGGGDINTGISSIAKKVIDIFSLVVGIVSVFMIIYAGFRYITSGGESSNTSGARNTLLYAIVGLIVVAIAQIIVRFVLNTSTTIQ